MRVVFGLGANLGDRADALRGAVHGLASLGEIQAVSSLFLTEPVGGRPGQPSHFNAAVRVATRTEPVAWLAAARSLELAARRIRAEPSGPRTLDVDVLWAEMLKLDTPELQVPHPRLAERPFAWIPLLEVAPDARAAEGTTAYDQGWSGRQWAGVIPVASARVWCPQFPCEIEQVRPI
ncbi:MAG: 2-amino-4-hydroxy-6-hydroxymethyldihydropteridine diphosphokinase [Polyangiaceae bacterium]